jgi:hypothetical protein
LRAHRMYWDDEEFSASCYSALIQSIYEKDNVLKTMNKDIESSLVAAIKKDSLAAEKVLEDKKKKSDPMPHKME